VVQRLWSALLLIVAYEGTRLVARALGLPAFGAILAGLVYAVSPRLLGGDGVLTGEILPSAVLPWAALPLVLAGAGRLSARQAGLWSGVAVLCMSGVNAAGTLATLPIAAIIVLDQLRRPHGRALAAWWAAAVIAACAWWMVPLLLLGKYSPPFLDFIETANATTFPTGWANDLRGADHWLAYYAIGDQPWWPGAHQIATQPLSVLACGVVATLGLVGLCHRELPLRRALIASALLGLLCLTAGNPATLGSLVDGPVRDLLDGPLAPFRNVHKVDPLVRLPLALGAGHAAVLLLRRWQPRRDLQRVTAVALTAVVIVSGAPLVTGDLRMPGFREVPEAWTQTADYLAQQPDSRALVLPGSGFGLQSWGWTIDEPLQGVSSSAWVTRSQVPLVPGPTARYLDTIERRVASGEGGDGLADLLARGGITHVVLRRDLNPFLTETVPVDRAELALVSSPGLEHVVGFGSSGFGDQAMIDIYRVDRDIASVDLLDADRLAQLHGAPDDVLTAIEAGVLDPEQPVVISPQATEPRIVGDGYPRVERQFGRVHDAVGQVMSRDEPWHDDRASPDFPGAPGVPRSTAEYVAGVEVTASTSQGYAQEFGPVLPAYGPPAAVDGDPGTEWRSGSLEPPAEQWLQVDLASPVAGGGTLRVQFEDRLDTARVARVRVAVDTEDGRSSAIYGVPASGLLLAPLPEGDLDRVRVSVVEATGDDAAYGRVAVSELVVPGVAPGRTTVLPGSLDVDDSLVLRLDPPRRACVDLGLGPHCVESHARAGGDGGRLDRTIDVAGAGEWDVSGSVVAAPGPGSAALFAPVDGTATARAGSVLAGDPAVSGVFAFDGNPDTPWLTASDTDRATLRLSFPGDRVISTLSIARPPGDVLAPASAVIRSGGEEQLVDLDFSDELEPFVARGRLRITFQRPEGVATTDRPMGIGEVEVGGLEGLAADPDWSGSTGALCGLGPEVRVDGVVHATSVSGTLEDVRLGLPMAWSVCDGPVAMAEGTHRIEVDSTLQFQPVTLGWRPAAASSAEDAGASRSLSVERWEATDRVVEVGSGDEAVLRVAENINEGWEATLDGESLEAVTIDGWQQGYRVPAGEGGEVSLVFEPDRTYRVSLLVGLGLAVLLVLAAVGGQVAARRRRQDEPAAPLPPEAGGVGRVGRLAAGVGLLVLGGPVAGAAYALAALPRLRHRVAVLGGALALASAGFAAATDATRFGSPGLGANLAAAAGVGLLVGSAHHATRSRRRTERLTVRARWVKSWRWTRGNAVVLIALGLVAGQAVLRTVVASGSYYWQDDFGHLELAHTLGLDRDFLVRDYSGHVEPGQYAVFWLISLFDTASFAPAVAVLVGLQVIASCLLLTLLRLLFGRSPWVLVPFAAYLFTPLGLATSTWLAAGMQALPLQISMLAAMVALVRFAGTGRIGWAVASWVAFAAGLACWEKAVLVLPALVALEVLVLAGGEPVRERLRRLGRQWWFWLVHVALLAAYVVGYLAITTSGEVGAPLQRSVGETLQEMFLAMLLPGLFGGPWDTTAAGNTIYSDTSWPLRVLFLVLALVVVVVSLVRRGRAAAAGWVLIVGYLVADTLLVFLGRGSYLNLVARDPRYFTDALPVVVIGVCAAFAAPQGRRVRWGVGATDPSQRRQLAVALVAVAAVVASSLVTVVKLAPLTQHQHARDYVEAVTRGLAADPGAAVLSSPVPQDVSLVVDLQGLLRAMGRDQQLDRPGSVPLLVDLYGALRPAHLIGVDLDQSGPVADCGWRVGRRPTVLVELDDRGAEQRVLRLGYVAGAPGVITIDVGGVQQAVEHDTWIGEVFFDVTGQSGPVEVSATRHGLCVSEVQRGLPWPVD
jgi:arabinofuranan 3-O-arabinosyltransferase